MSKQKVVRFYDKDLGLYLDMVKSLNKELRLSKYNIIKSNPNNIILAKKLYSKYKKDITKLIKRLEKRLKIQTIDKYLRD